MAENSTWRANILLLITAAIWGCAFVAQKAGMAYVGPFTFNAVRFLLGALSLVPVLWLFKPQGGKHGRLLEAGLLTGLALFAGSTLQQIGIVYTDAGKAGFITGLYVVFVPLLGWLLGRLIRKQVWLAVILAVAGMYLLSVTDDLRMQKGDFLVLCSALFWAMHVLLVDRYVQQISGLILALTQFLVCALCSVLMALVFEQPAWPQIQQAWLPIVYAGVGSVGIAYTLQVLAQKEAHPAHAAIILSSEGVFAVACGWLLLGEQLTPRMLIGCGLILLAMIVAQLRLGRATPAQRTN